MKVFAAIAAVASARTKDNGCRPNLNSCRLTNVVPGGDNNPCPSDCWDWNASDATCKIKPGAVNGVLTDCFSVTCNFGSMEVDVDPKLFGLSGNDTVFANGANFDSGSFKYNQPLGDSNQVISIVNDTLNVAVDFELGMGSVSLGNSSAVNVFLAPVSSAVTFTCEYDTTVEVASQNLTVNGATAIGATSATGSLVDGFQLSLWTDQNMTDAVTDDNLFIGAKVYGSLDWSVTTAANLTFTIDECTVESNNQEVAFIKDGCYSNTLGADKVASSGNVEKNFAFNSFTLGNAQNIQMNATVACTVVVCETGNCNSPSSCPVVTGYDYAVKSV